MNELKEWLERNKITYKVIDDEVIELPGLGKMYFEDTDNMKSIFRTNKDDELIFNSMEDPDVLIAEGIYYVVFKFGDNWYYFDLRKDFKLNILKYIGQREKPKNNFKFANLGVHTPYELLNGSFMPSYWVAKAKYLGHRGIGICDKNTMAACYNLQKECEAAGLKYVFGYSLDFFDGENTVGAKVYAQSQKGLQNLLRIQKAIMVDSNDKKIQLEELLDRGEGNVIVLDKYSSFWMTENMDVVETLQSCFDCVFYQVDLTEYKAERIDIKVLEASKHYFDHIYNKVDVYPVLLTDAYYLDEDDAKNKIILNKVAEGAAHEQSNQQYFKDVDEQYQLFADTFDSEKWDVDALFQECCDNTLDILNHAEARFENDRNFMPKYDMTPDEKKKYGTTHNMFIQLLEEGLQRLVPSELHDKYRKQMEYERYIIESTNNVDYLLVQYDTCNWARRNNILVGCGRGSAAGCLLLYLLGITLIDPIRYNLIFERFLLPERAGLYPAQTTIIGEDIDSNEFVEVKLDGGQCIKIDKDAQLIVKRPNIDEPIVIYADELLPDDDILFDNKDQIFTINEL